MSICVWITSLIATQVCGGCKSHFNSGCIIWDPSTLRFFWEVELPQEYVISPLWKLCWWHCVLYLNYFYIALIRWNEQEKLQKKKKTSSLVIYDFTGLEIKNIMARNMAAGRQIWCGSRSGELTSWNNHRQLSWAFETSKLISPSDTCPVTRPHFLIFPKYFHLLGTHIQT